MDNNLLKYLAFVKTVEMGSFTKAARELNYAQSSISKMIADLENETFLLLEHGGKTEVSEILEKSNVHPKIRFTTWEDFAIMAMVEKGLGVAILPEMILQGVHYKMEVRPLEKPYYRKICLVMKDKKRLTPAAERFVEYL